MGSDHCLLLLKPVAHKNQRKVFKFDKRWLTNLAISSIVFEAWDFKVNDSPQFRVQQKLNNVCNSILAWLKRNNQNSPSRVAPLQRQLLTLSRQHDNNSIEARKATETALLKAIQEEETFWRQKSRIKWLKEGDKNLAFFHATTKIRRSYNTIHRMQNEDDNLVELRLR
ncbi:hypothetical protein Cni_G23469 [Canna indica]|uniref:Uncharacterized protein n=1 Tax=Canna indica TaxID=4628 RepID=A0AAQ3KTI7_9LILI|nr:hypothetical protein Cni_G23469 [Canna indica]